MDLNKLLKEEIIKKGEELNLKKFKDDSNDKSEYIAYIKAVNEAFSIYKLFIEKLWEPFIASMIKNNSYEVLQPDNNEEKGKIRIGSVFIDEYENHKKEYGEEDLIEDIGYYSNSHKELSIYIRRDHMNTFHQLTKLIEEFGKRNNDLFGKKEGDNDLYTSFYINAPFSDIISSSEKEQDVLATMELEIKELNTKIGNSFKS